MNIERAKEIVKSVIKDRNDFLKFNWDNFKKTKEKENMYQSTVEKISLDALINLLEHPEIENVYFHSSVAPPGSGVDGIALRYRIYFLFKD